MFVLFTGMAWRHLPRELGCFPATAHRRLAEWERAGVWGALHHELLRRLNRAGRIDWSAKFLGCRPKLPAAQITYEFVKAAGASFNEDVQSPKRRGRYQVALLSVIQDNTTTITPRNFAETHLEGEDRQPFLERVEKAAGVTPNTTFGKDTSRVNVSRFRMTFTSGNLVLVGDREALDSTVVIPDDDRPDDPVELRTRVDDVLTGN